MLFRRFVAIFCATSIFMSPVCSAHHRTETHQAIVEAARSMGDLVQAETALNETLDAHDAGDIELRPAKKRVLEALSVRLGDVLNQIEEGATDEDVDTALGEIAVDFAPDAGPQVDIVLGQIGADTNIIWVWVIVIILLWATPAY